MSYGFFSVLRQSIDQGLNPVDPRFSFFLRALYPKEPSLALQFASEFALTAHLRLLGVKKPKVILVAKGKLTMTLKVVLKLHKCLE
ncbi:hypothetical protein GW17_00039334 [Ensete ventricosum]|nr:hypothetical protein GW17_00039334 [Ensete ventricosum]